MNSARKPALRAVIYARKSTDDKKGDDQSLSVSEQILSCKKLAKQAGYEVVGTFTDDGISGRTPPAGYEQVFDSDEETQTYIAKMRQKTRPGFGEVCKRIEQGEVDILLVRDMTRVARPRFLSALMTWIPTLLRKHKVKVHSVTEGLLDPANQQQMMFSIIRDAMIDDEVARRAKLSAETKAKQRREGKYSSLCPFGYELIGGNYVPHQKYAPAVRLMISLRAKGKSFSDIIQSLQEKNVKRADGKWFSQQQISGMVVLPVYAGLMNLGSIEEPDFITATNVKPIVSKQRVLKCIELRKTNAEKFADRPRAAGGRLLSGLIVCGYCGEPMVCNVSSGVSTKGRDIETLRRYVCSGRRSSRSCNTPVSILTKQIEDFVGRFAILHTVTQQNQQEQSEALRAELPILHERLTTIRNKRFALLRDESLDVDFVREAGQELSRQLNEIQKQIHIIESLPEAKVGKGQTIVNLSKLSAEERRDILRLYVKEVKILRDRIELGMFDDKVIAVERLFKRQGRWSMLPHIQALPTAGEVHFSIDGKEGEPIIGDGYTVSFDLFAHDDLMAMKKVPLIRKERKR